VEEDERYYAGRTLEQAAADEEAEDEVKNHIVFNPEDEEDEEEVKTTEWTCQNCSAVWRTKTKTD
jgi:hypothetical protein